MDTFSFKREVHLKPPFLRSIRPSIYSHTSVKGKDLEGSMPGLITFLAAIPQVPEFCSLFV